MNLFFDKKLIIFVPDSFVEMCVDKLYCCKPKRIEVEEEAIELPKKKIPSMKDQVKVESVTSQVLKGDNNELNNMEVHRELSENSSKTLLKKVRVFTIYLSFNTTILLNSQR